MRPCENFRQLTLDCRGHGHSGLGDPDLLSFETFAADLLALLAVLKVSRVVFGGISMGAAVALACARAAGGHPAVDGLILVRPAWGERAMYEPARTAYREIAHLLRCYPPVLAADRFKRSTIFRELVEQGPAAAESLLGHFNDPRVATFMELCERLPAQAPLGSSSFDFLHVPTLIIATDRDPVHPLPLARQLADQIGPSARLAQVISKSDDGHRHQREVERLVHEFLDENAPSGR